MPANRREFLGRVAAAGMAAAGGLLPRDVAAADAPSSTSPSEPPAPEKRRLVIVVFGGGTRSSEAIGDPRAPLHSAPLEGTRPPRHALDEHAGRAPRGASELQRLDQDGPLGVGRPGLVEAAPAPDGLRDRPQAPAAARHGRLVVRLRLDPGQHGPQHGGRFRRRRLPPTWSSRRRSRARPPRRWNAAWPPPARADRPRPKRRPPPSAPGWPARTAGSSTSGLRSRRCAQVARRPFPGVAQGGRHDQPRRLPGRQCDRLHAGVLAAR